jgi:hypothetical protein
MGVEKGVDVANLLPNQRDVKVQQTLEEEEELPLEILRLWVDGVVEVWRRQRMAAAVVHALVMWHETTKDCCWSQPPPPPTTTTQEERKVVTMAKPVPPTAGFCSPP